MKRYWHCIIGPIEEDGLEFDEDATLRGPVQDAFEKRFPGKKFECWSGWGCDEVGKDLSLSVTHIAFEATKKTTA